MILTAVGGDGLEVGGGSLGSAGAVDTVRDGLEIVADGDVSDLDCHLYCQSLYMR